MNIKSIIWKFQMWRMSRRLDRKFPKLREIRSQISKARKSHSKVTHLHRQMVNEKLELLRAK